MRAGTECRPERMKILKAPAETPVSAPSAPTDAPAIPAAAPSAAPSVPTSPTTLDDFSLLASQSMQAPAPEVAPAEPTPPPAPVAPEESPVATVAAADPLPAEAEADADAPSAEVLASLNEAGRRALQAEREKRKEARTEVRLLREQLEALQKQITQPETPATPPAPEAPTPRVAVPPVLAECTTFEAVDARAMQAVQQEALAMQLNTTLATQGLDAVIEQFKANGIEKLDNRPLEAYDAGQMAAFLSNKYQQARTVQLNAEPRKQFLVQEARSLEAAVKLVPEIKDAKSPRAQKFAAIVNQNPWLKQQGPNWPQVAATYLLGMERSQTATTQPAPVAAAPAPPARPAPSASRITTAALPAPDAGQELSVRLANGTATLEEVQRAAAGQIRVPSH